MMINAAASVLDIMIFATAAETRPSGRVQRNLRPIFKLAPFLTVGFLLVEPIDEQRDTIFDLSLRIVIEQSARLRDIGKRLRHVARLRWLSIDLRFFSEGVFQ